MSSAEKSTLRDRPPTTAKTELKDEELNQVTGGAGAGPVVKLGDIKGESTDKDHKDW